MTSSRDTSEHASRTTGFARMLDRHGHARSRADREPLTQRVTAAACYAMIIAIAVIIALQPVSDDLGPGQGAVLTGLLTPIALAAINRRARSGARRPPS
jgi:hypothetical protein